MNPVHCKAVLTQMVDNLDARSSNGVLAMYDRRLAPGAAGPRCCMIAANSTKLGVDPTGHVS
jgi:hypothetical protein